MITTDQGTGANGYPLIKVDVAGGSYSSDAATSNANGSANKAGVILSGQIAFWLPKSAVDAALAATGRVNFYNSIGSGTAPITAPAVAGDVPTGLQAITGIPGTHATSNETKTGDNTSSVFFSTGGGNPPGNPAGTNTYHYAFMTPEYIQTEYNTTATPHTMSLSRLNGGQIPSWNTTNGSVWSGKGTRSRGSSVYLQMLLSVRSTTPHSSPIQGCMSWDPIKMYLQPHGTIPFKTWNGSVYEPDRTLQPTDQFSNVFIGEGGPAAGNTQEGSVAWRNLLADAFFTERPQSDTFKVIVEYGYDDPSVAYSETKSLNGVECNNTPTRLTISVRATS